MSEYKRPELTDYDKECMAEFLKMSILSDLSLLERFIIACEIVDKRRVESINK